MMKVKRNRFRGAKGNGTTQEELELLREIYNSQKDNQPVKPKKGDILGIRRTQGLIGNLYEHYGIYTDKHTVIHYTTLGVTLNLEIMETSLKDFIKSEKDFFVLSFDRLKNPVKSKPIPAYEVKQILCPECWSILRSMLEVREMLHQSQMKIYSPEETVKRARSRLGEKEYNLLLNNCEHFAIWCKTGLSKSYQIEKLLKVLKPEKGFL
ncbi:MAG TPA: lecithin retinol acyltransferase family protein [Desulfobacteria bacterium]|nr:lecithin retinol acyltransferase family protein [Desulfobacteria bacterium]